MATVAFLKGINVGGHRRFRPAVLADQLRRFNVVNIGSTGTLVVLEPVGRNDLRAEIAGRVPFRVEVMLCGGGEILRLVAGNPFAGEVARQDVVPFVGVMAGRKRLLPTIPFTVPAGTDWHVNVSGFQGRVFLGLYRRQMRTIACFGPLEKAVGASLAIRGWNTILAVEKALPRQASK